MSSGVPVSTKISWVRVHFLNSRSFIAQVVTVTLEVLTVKGTNLVQNVDSCQYHLIADTLELQQQATPFNVDR